MQLAPFDPTKKKKKKKVVIQDPADEPVEQLVEKTESLSGKLIDLLNFLKLCYMFYVLDFVIFKF